MRGRKPKDAYDVVWLLDALGPQGAAAQISDGPLLNEELAADLLGNWPGSSPTSSVTPRRLALRCTRASWE